MNSLSILLLGKEKSALAEIASTLSGHQEFTVAQLISAEQAWAYLKRNKVEVVVVDERLQDSTGIGFIKELVPRNPFINCALVSSLPNDLFHEVTEGYGVFMQLPVRPTAQSAKEMIEQLDKIYNLTH